MSSQTIKRRMLRWLSLCFLGALALGASPLKPASAQAEFPIHYSSPVDLIDGDYHFYMQTNVTVSDNGRIDWTTTVASTYWLRGFTGGQILVVTDASDNVLWKSDQEQYGHGGTWINGGPRVIPNGSVLPPEVMEKAAKIGVMHYHAPKNRLVEDIVVGAPAIGAIVAILVAIF
jgi:hypothetical protein